MRVSVHDIPHHANEALVTSTPGWVHHLGPNGEQPLCGDPGPLRWWHWTSAAERVTCPRCAQLIARR